jgi:hypothetical protein
VAVVEMALLEALVQAELEMEMLDLMRQPILVLEEAVQVGLLQQLQVLVAVLVVMLKLLYRLQLLPTLML